MYLVNHLNTRASLRRLKSNWSPSFQDITFRRKETTRLYCFLRDRRDRLWGFRGLTDHIFPPDRSTWRLCRKICLNVLSVISSPTISIISLPHHILRTVLSFGLFFDENKKVTTSSWIRPICNVHMELYPGVPRG